MRHRRPIITALFALLCHAAFCATAHAQPSGKLGPSGTALAVRVGWGGSVAPGRWNPVYITLSDPASRSVTLEFRAPHGSFVGMKSRLVLAIGPEPQTFVVYMPLRNFVADDLSFVVRDGSTRRRLADYPGGPYLSFATSGTVAPGFSFLGISGRRATLGSVTAALPAARLGAAHVETDELPTSAIGYDCLDVLVLNAPDLTKLSADQEQAILEWTRTGGNVLMWPGDSPVPESGPLIDALPCRIGTTEVIELSPEELTTAGLTQRFARLPARKLLPVAGAEPLKLLGSDRITGWQRRLGLGRIVVCHVDLASLQINDPRKTWALWRVVLKGMIRRLPEDGAAPLDPSYGYGPGESQQREATAVRQVGDLLGNVPGAGQFGFGYVAGILIGMMVIVGPVDWVLLKKLGRQPWTWATTSGWIALVTLAAVYAGHMFKSGELHFRTFQLVDQVDALAVARTDMSALYSPRTTEYTLETRADEWWQPASPGDEYYGYRRSGQEIVFAQTYRASTPDPMVVNVWNLRFLSGESTTAAPPLVEANLKVVTRPVQGKPRKYLVGTIRNVGLEPLTNVAVRTQAGWVRPFTASSDTQPATPLHVAPGQTANVDALVDPAPPPEPVAANDWQRVRYPHYVSNVAQIDRTRLWDQGGDLSMRRTDRIEQWLTERADLACVYAECENPSAVVDLKGGQPIEAHWKVVRALVPLGK
jgi:hypothetical protein